MELVPFGARLEPQEEASLTVPAARAAAAAVREDAKKSRLLELRHDDVSDILVVECRTHVFSCNAVGIKHREALALRFFRDESKLPEVRALRPDFPELLHENEQPAGEPIGLCVYQEPWTELRRTWTPQQFLRRIEWWLKAAAEGRLHPLELRPEQLFFDSPFIVVLPHDFDQRTASKDEAITLEGRTPDDAPKWVAAATFRPVGRLQSSPTPNFSVVALRLPEVEQGRPERTPATLGNLHDRLAARGAPIAERLFTEIKRIANGGSLAYVPNQKTLLILSVPIRNPGGGVVTERRGFLIRAGIGELGVRAGFLGQENDKGMYVPVLFAGEAKLKPAWREASVIAPVDLREALTPEKARRYSGVPSPGPHGVLAGFGALGSAVADNWAREGWGSWSFIDSDVLLPHNLARHRAWEPMVGMPKAAVAQLLQGGLYPGAEAAVAIQASANDFANSRVVELLKAAELIVDITTSVGVPRDLARRDDLRRCVSAFITPSGNDSVLLLEDAERQIRLDCLEPQYYRFILNAAWGSEHLKGHRGELYTGAGCRDISSIIPCELGQLHGALLARQIRLLVGDPQAQMQIWRSNPDTGEVSTNRIEVHALRIGEGLTGEIVWDEGLRTKLRQMRDKALPKESGGVLLGYTDQMTVRTYVVDALSPPPDSYHSREEFRRGVQGLAARVKEAAERTANIVGYIGEWHSHPQGVKADPSHTDLFQLVELAMILRQDGAQALMLIVGDSDERWLNGVAI
jgi:integrative and conjugative element protein (TIGR02256 family)